MLSPSDHARVAEAVGRAEAATSGEIVCILAAQASAYRETPLGFAAVAALLAPPLLILLGLPAHVLTPWLRTGADAWTAGGPGAQASAASVISAYALAQALIFAAVAGIASIPAVRDILTPGPLKRHRVHRMALQQFLATGLHLSKTRTGVVIFASMAERRVELLADDAIHTAVGDAAWEGAVAAVQDGMRRGKAADGFVKAIELCGAALAEHFPPTAVRANALPDHLLEL